MATKKKTTATEKIDLPDIKVGRVKCRISGDRLLIHGFSKEKQKAMQDKQQKKAKNAKEARDPERDFEEAKVLDAKGRPCIKALWVKCAMVNAARMVDGLPMTTLRQVLFVRGDCIPIKFEEEAMHSDVVRNANGVADLRFRPLYTEWSAEIEIEYLANMLSPSQVLNLLRLAGFGVGLGERRPQQKVGDTYGRFDVEAA